MDDKGTDLEKEGSKKDIDRGRPEGTGRTMYPGDKKEREPGTTEGSVSRRATKLSWKRPQVVREDGLRLPSQAQRERYRVGSRRGPCVVDEEEV